MYRLFGKICCADRSWKFIFLVMEKSWKIIVEKEWSSCVNDKAVATCQFHSLHVGKCYANPVKDEKCKIVFLAVTVP